MDTATFDIEIKALFNYFQRKQPERQSVSLWFESVNHIPENAVDWIRQWISKEFDGIPRNVAKAFNAGWYQWQASNNIGAENKVVLDGVTGRYKWHDDPDGTEYISLKEFKRRFPEYAKKLEGLGARFGNILKELPGHIIYQDEVPF